MGQFQCDVLNFPLKLISIFYFTDHHPPPLPPRLPKRPTVSGNGTVAPVGSPLLPLSSGSKGTPGSSLSASTISLRSPASTVSQIRSETHPGDRQHNELTNFSLQNLQDEKEHLKKLLHDEIVARNKYSRQLEAITQKINSIPLPSSVEGNLYIYVLLTGSNNQFRNFESR